MPLPTGTRIGPYEILSPLGTGGMGEVYRARDGRLHRDVAIKTLPALFATDSDRLARFAREAQVLASLNHPNIASLYGFEETGDLRGLVMELVEGPTLAEAIARASRGMPVAETLPIARQIIDALEVAHEHGVVHRDLKPGNVKLTSSGAVKVLDFGLAKALGPESMSGNAESSPTVTSLGTRAGIILGTAAYMSPEQARGQPVDKRADIWAFGCVLYEMLTGRRAFEGDNVTDLLAGIVGRDPDYDALPAATSPAIRRLVRRCLEKDRRRRLSDIADARLEIDEAVSLPSTGAVIASPPHRPSRARWVLAAGVAALGVMAGVIASAWWRAPALPPRTARFIIAPPSTEPLYAEATGTPITVSPDGQYVVYVGVRRTWQLFLRRIDQLEAVPMPGTEGARQPFFSHDGKSVGFWSPADAELRRVAVGGGSFTTICKTPSGILYGASWGAGDTIVFGSASLFRVSANGGTPEVLTTPNAAAGEFEHRWPEILPDGRTVLFTAWGGGFDRTKINSRSLVSSDVKPLIEGGTSARYSPTGHLIYFQAGTLMAAPFDPVRVEVSGTRVPLQEPVQTSASGVANFALSRTGTLVLIPGTARPERKLVWVDRKNIVTQLPVASDDYWLPRLSPDGNRLAVGIGSDIWAIELVRFTRTRLTYGTTSVLFPFAWTRDGTRVTFSKIESKIGLDLHSVAADGSGQPELLLRGEERQWATSWSPTADVLATYEQHPKTLRDIWLVNPDRTRAAFLVTPYQERAPRFSPDGHWIAYVSNDSGRDEVYVRPASGGGGKTTVSTEGGIEPVWAASGRELFYRNGDDFMVAPVDTVPAMSIGRPTRLFTAAYERDRGAGFANPNYDVARDGQRFIMVQPPATSSNIVVVLNWPEELKVRLGAAR
jgi:serine/threonine-protein kinase